MKYKAQRFYFYLDMLGLGRAATSAVLFYFCSLFA